MILAYPMKLTPCCQDYLWGGDGLTTLFNKVGNSRTIAESWELSCHENGLSLVAEGEHKEKILADVLASDWQGYVGTSAKEKKFPILVKFIDASKDLSVQVHPSDESADAWLGEQGKAEMWYIVDRKPQSYIYYGFSKKIDPDEFTNRAINGSICEVLNRVEVEKGDVYYILPGMIHALGAGIIAAEIQHNTDTTFRIYDYKRLDKDGKPRALHVERAAKVISYEPVVPSEIKLNIKADFKDFTMSKMFGCAYFKAFKLDVKTKAALCCDGSTFHHLLCVEGGGVLKAAGDTYRIERGDSYFLPACLGDYEIHGQSRLLLTHI
jgi:mannose-6-phosphate isomerase